jgi:hypothetical protein
LDYAELLNKAGVEIKLSVWKGFPHTFFHDAKGMFLDVAHEAEMEYGVFAQRLSSWGYGNRYFEVDGRGDDPLVVGFGTEAGIEEQNLVREAILSQYQEEAIQQARVVEAKGTVVEVVIIGDFNRHDQLWGGDDVSLERRRRRCLCLGGTDVNEPLRPLYKIH